MFTRRQWRRFIDHPVTEWSIFAIGVVLIILSPVAGVIPGPGGIFVFAIGLAMVLKTSMWAKRRYVKFKRWQPKAGRWADWGRALMDLHIGYESVAPFASLKRTDVPDEKARAAGQAPKCILKSDAEAGRIVIDSETVLSGIPPEAWTYRLGNRSAIDWVLDQHKEKKPNDPTIRAKFDTYRFADHKERVIDLLARVTTVSLETMRIVAALRDGPR